MVRVLFATVLNCNVPETVVVLAVAVVMSTVTVVPPAISTGLQAVGTTPESHVEGNDQAVLATLVNSEQPTAPQSILLLVSLRSNASPDKGPEYCRWFQYNPVLEPAMV